MTDGSDGPAGSTPSLAVDLDERGGVARSINAVSRAARGVIRERIPEPYRETIDRVAAAVGTTLAVLALAVSVWMLLRIGLWVVGPAVGLVSVQTQQYTFAIRILGFLVLAQMWDLVGGQMGYISFGNITFFGLGVYVMVVLLNGTAPWIGAVGFRGALLLAGLVPLAYALVIGVPLLRLRGHYFAVATLGVYVATQQIIANLEETGGGSGITIDVPQFAQADRTFFLLFFGLAVVTVLAYWYLTTTRFGYGLNAIRDDEGKARAQGLPTTYYKTVAWGISGLFTGVAGGLFAVHNIYVNPYVAFSADWNLILILMALAGGVGRLWGPVVGAALLWQIRNTLWSNPPWVERLSTAVGFPIHEGYLLVFGVLLVFIVIFAPEGVLGYLSNRGVFDAVRKRVRGTPVEPVLEFAGGG